jgi:hypothetical protein
MIMRKISIIIIAAMFCFLGAPTLSSAVPIEGDGPLGDFTGTFIYKSIDASESTIEIELTNTSPMSNGGYLTAFAFNLPSDYITGVSLESSDDDFGLLGGPDFYDDVKGVPYGYFDIGASVTNQFLGGGAPSPGIPVGVTETFKFTLYGDDLDMLDLDSFLDEMSAGASPGKGSQFFLARFRGFDDGGSNKTPGRVVPVPGALWLLGAGLIGLAGFRRKL